MKHFISGFEKRSYDYAQEKKDRELYAKARQGATPISWLKALGIGGATGAGIGALIGALHQRSGMGAGVGALMGGGVGLGLGGIAGLHDRADIAEQQKVMAMSPKERGMYLASRARQSERDDANEQHDDRHRELVSAIGRR